MDARLGDEGPAVDEVDLLGRLAGRVRSRRAQRFRLQEERGGEADGEAGAAAEAGADGDGGADRVGAGVQRAGRAEREEEVEEGEGGGSVDLAGVLGEGGRDGVDVRLESFDELEVEGCQVLVLLVAAEASVPGEIFDVPSMVQIDIGGDEGDGAVGLGKEGHQEVGAKGYRGGDGSLDVY